MTHAFDHNRAILCHFDSYSTLLLFARFGQTILLPGAVPGASPDAAADPATLYQPSLVRDALAEHCGLMSEELIHVVELDEWLSTPAGTLRVHLFRNKSFAPPREAIEARGGKWKPLSEMRGIAAHELGYVRRAFDVIMGGGG